MAAIKFQCHIWHSLAYYLFNCNLFNELNNTQSLHRLEKYLNILDCVEKSLKIEFALKHSKALKSP